MPLGTQSIISWKIAGAAGMGTTSTGEMMAKALSRAGLWVVGYSEYPSLIRGGHTVSHVLASKDQITAPKKKVSVMVALNQDGVLFYKDELDSETHLVVDKGLDIVGIAARLVQLPIVEKAKELGNVIVQNMICLGVSAAFLGIEPEIFVNLIEEQLGKKKDLLEMNKKAFMVGYEMIGDDREEVKYHKVEDPKMIISGSQAIGMGLVAAGLQFYAAYPMTPSTPLLHYLVAHQEGNGLVARQAEDEIGAINMALGASFAGAKAATGTSGGGFALMQEAISLTGMLELPLVVMLAMRPGPATGLPTWTGQGELRFAIHAGHGEFPKIVLAPGDMEEAYELAYRAVELSQKYQTVVILLTDKLLNETYFSVENLSDRQPVPLMNIEIEPSQPEGQLFHRYQPTPDGVGMRTLPGIRNGFYIANSDEHGPDGLVDETVEMRKIMVQRRLNKLKAITSEMQPPNVYGPEEAGVTLVGWGSTKGSILEAMKELDGVNFVHFTHVWPLPKSARGILEGKKLYFIENNMSGQFEGLVREILGLGASGNLRKDDGRPFYPEEIVNFVKSK